MERGREGRGGELLCSRWEATAQHPRVQQIALAGDGPTCQGHMVTPQQFAPSDIPWAAGSPPTPKLCHVRQCPGTGASRASSCPCNPWWAWKPTPHRRFPSLLLLPVKLQLLSLEIELREAWAFPFAQMRWGVLRGRGCYNWITRCVTNHSAGNHSDCGFNLTWSFPSHRMTQPSAAGQAAAAWGWGTHPHPHCQTVRGWGGAPVLSPSLCWWPSGQVWVGWERGRWADRSGSLWRGWASAKKSSSRCEIGVFPRGGAQAWHRDKPIALHLCVWM